jgi:hypothetical protein
MKFGQTIHGLFLKKPKKNIQKINSKKYNIRTIIEPSKYTMEARPNS